MEESGGTVLTQPRITSDMALALVRVQQDRQEGSLAVRLVLVDCLMQLSAECLTRWQDGCHCILLSLQEDTAGYDRVLRGMSACVSMSDMHKWTAACVT